MRAFHFAWLSFFCAFVCWFAFAPLMVLVKADLELNLSQVFTTNILSVAGTVFCRFAIGPLCDKIGPKICQFSLLSWIAVFTLLGMSVNSYGAGVENKNASQTARRRGDATPWPRRPPSTHNV